MIVLAAALMLAGTAYAVADRDRLPVAATTAPAVSTPISPAVVSTSAGPAKFGPGVTDPVKADSKKFGPGVTKPQDDITGLGIAAWRLWLVVILLVGMLGAMLYVLRKYGRGILPKSNAEIVQIKAKIQLDARNSVSVLRIYDEEYVVGAGAQGVNLLARLMPIDGVETETPESPEAAGTAGLRRAAGKIEEDFSRRFENLVDHEEVK